MNYSKLHWWSDWSGDEIGYDEALVVGLYSLIDFPEIHMYIDVDNDVIIDVWVEEE